MKTYYSLPMPYSLLDSHRIEVYGDGDMGWYEWRVVAAGVVQKDSKDRCYGAPEVALRDALNFAIGDCDA